MAEIVKELKAMIVMTCQEGGKKPELWKVPFFRTFPIVAEFLTFHIGNTQKNLKLPNL